ncbi:MAG: hypothetical protein IKW83_09040 [Muribaculaceae bacterium]|nr:hypothetical protein [Muribaculaceae bacterium]
MNLRFLFLAIFLLPLIMLAQETSTIDTVKVIDKPNQVVIAEDGDQVVVNVNGAYRDSDYKYEYRAKPSSKGFVSEQNENHKLRFEHPFSKCDNDSSKRSFDLFMSDIYFGWGGNSVEAGTRDIIKRSHSEVGILNFVGLGVNLNRTRLSIGMGFNWAHYGLNKPYIWNRNNNGVVGLEPLNGETQNLSTSLLVRSMQFPLLFNQYLGKHWDISAGPIFNWNFYADFHTSYSNGVNDYSVTTHGLYQRKFSVDGIVMVSWRGIGAYFRYAPQSVFKTGFGPEIKNRWTLGIVIRGCGFCGK